MVEVSHYQLRQYVLYIYPLYTVNYFSKNRITSIFTVFLNYTFLGDIVIKNVSYIIFMYHL